MLCDKDYIALVVDCTKDEVGDIYYERLWSPTSKNNSAATFAPMLGILNQKLEAKISETSNRWRGGWSKKIICHDLAILEGVWDTKIDCIVQETYLFDKQGS